MNLIKHKVNQSRNSLMCN